MANKFYGGIVAGSVDVSIPVELRTTGTSIETTGKVYTDVTASYWRQDGIRVAISTATLASANSTHTDGGFVQVDATNQPGAYRLDLPDAAVATGSDWVVVSVKVTGCFVYHVQLPLSTDVIQTGDSFARIGAAGAGLTALPVTGVETTTVLSVLNRLNSALVQDGGVYQFTANALELGPATAYGGPTVTQIRQEMDSNSTKLANLDATIASRMATFTVPASFAVADFSVLPNLNATITSRLASASYTAPSNLSAATIADAVWDEEIQEGGAHSGANSAAGQIQQLLNNLSGLQSSVDSGFSTTFSYLEPTEEDDAILLVSQRLNTMLEEDGLVYKFTTNALENSPSGIIGVGTATLENQQAILAALTTASVTVTSPLSPDGGIVRLVEGDSYYAAEGRQLDFTSEDWPVLTGGSFSLKVEDDLTVAGSITAARTLRVQLSSANTTALGVGKFKFHLDGTLSNGHHVTLLIGSVFVEENL